MGYYDTFGEDARRKSRKLIDLEVEEISLVDRAATGERFAIIKRALPEELPQEIDDFLEGQELEKDEAAAQEAVAAAIKALKVFEEDFPDDVLAAIKTLSKWAVAGAYPEAPADSDYGKSKKGRLAKGGLWPSLGISMIGLQRDRDRDVARDDDGLPEHVPERRGVSKGLKGQEGDDDKTKAKDDVAGFWPSLS